MFPQPLFSSPTLLYLLTLLPTSNTLCLSHRERGAKVALQLDPEPTKGCEVLYPGTVPDSRLLWATLTPRGTTHHLTVPSAPPTPAKSFDNSGFVDPDDYLRLRPRVSPPTRIEHPNLPPLNLHRTLRREGSDTAPMV